MTQFTIPSTRTQESRCAQFYFSKRLIVIDQLHCLPPDRTTQPLEVKTQDSTAALHRGQRLVKKPNHTAARARAAQAGHQHRIAASVTVHPTVPETISPDADLLPFNHPNKSNPFDQSNDKQRCIASRQNPVNNQLRAHRLLQILMCQPGFAIPFKTGWFPREPVKPPRTAATAGRRFGLPVRFCEPWCQTPGDLGPPWLSSLLPRRSLCPLPADATTLSITLSHNSFLCSRAETHHHHSSGGWSKRREFCKQEHWSFLPLPWLLLLLAVLGDAVAAVAVPRPLLGIAEPPAASPAAAAAGPVGATQPGGGGRPDRSVAGADVILVGFAAAVVVVIFLYIRVTRKNGSGMGVGEKQEGSSSQCAMPKAAVFPGIQIPERVFCPGKRTWLLPSQEPGGIQLRHSTASSGGHPPTARPRGHKDAAALTLTPVKSGAHPLPQILELQRLHSDVTAPLLRYVQTCNLARSVRTFTGQIVSPNLSGRNSLPQSRPPPGDLQNSSSPSPSLGSRFSCASRARPRPLLGIAEPPASPGALAAGPAASAQPGGGSRPDRSQAGGEVILAGFAAALIIVIFCYIRVTRETSDSSVGAGEKKETLGGPPGGPTTKTDQITHALPETRRRSFNAHRPFNASAGVGAHASSLPVHCS
ncbi:hypothetical protein HU200_022460 [Digitaria exilis]|uniref:Uncharacterized protein n=1 Tax=Digitaria exilis TaxID=1010633 RepID=A0A835EXL9_9POAL|nr:hypothetical protein HU200_022460 [Digitaria exilis]